MSMSNLCNVLKRFLQYSSFNIYKANVHNHTEQCLKTIFQYYPQISPKTSNQFLGYVKPNSQFSFKIRILLPAGLLSWLGLSNEEEEKDEMLICMKRSILCIQRGELAKAEQMLHLALRLAQEKQNSLGVTYIYDLMANLAIERGEIDKAEKLFITVMQHLLSTGTKEDDLKMIHISLKLSQIYQTRHENDKAEHGFTWSILNLKNHLKIAEQNATEDQLGLYSMAQYWYGLFLVDQEKYTEAHKYLKAAYDIYMKLENKDKEQQIVFLNNMGSVNLQIGDYKLAELQLKEALQISESLNETPTAGLLNANLGLVYLQQGLFEEAKKCCSFAYRLAKRLKNKEAEDQAKYCIDELKLATARQK